MKFTEITECLPYPKKLKARLSKDHSVIITYVVKHFKSTMKYKSMVLNALNSITYATLMKEAYDINADNPIEALQLYDNDTLKDGIIPKYPDLYIYPQDIEWDITPTIVKAKEETPAETKSKPKSKAKSAPAPQIDTPKEWLYLRAPQYPRMDIHQYVLSDIIGTERFYMFPSLPIIPERQNEISCTTDVTKMTDRELLRLFPNRFIRTRAEVMYTPIGDIPMDKDLGLLLPIGNFTPEQFRENIIQYPHIYKLTRILDNKEISFYKHIEIDGELHDTLEVWDSLPDTKYIPKTAEFIKEYVVRKYLLERSVGVEHKYPIRGTLNPYVTLFAPPEFYGGDTVELARNCVRSRVSYYKSRNPFLERYGYVRQGKLPPYQNWNNNCPFKQFCTNNECRTVCANLAEFSYLMERNGMKDDVTAYMHSPKALQDASEWLTRAEGCYKVITPPDTAEAASCLTYVAICNYYKGNTFHCSVYHLNFMEYINKLQQSWTNGMDDDLEYTQIFIEKAKVLIISNLDFMQFKDFQAQTLLNLAHNRKLHKQSTIIVSPKLNSLIGSGPFFSKMKEVFGKEVIDT